MRGRAGSAALPALVVLVLVAVVAIAATGSVPKGSNESRAPSETLLDTFFTLWIIAVIAGGVLLVYGLVQRQAIAKMAASGYPRFTLASFLAFVGVGTVLIVLFHNWRPSSLENLAEDGVFGGEITVPTTSDDFPLRSYEPSVTWLPFAVVGGLVAIAAVAYVVAVRRRRSEIPPEASLAEDLALALDDALDDLRAEADPRRAIIAAYARLERVLAAHGIPSRPSETPDEYLTRVLDDLELTPGAVGRLTALFEEAKFSHHNVDSAMKESAIGALEQVRDELRMLRDGAHAAQHPAPRIATS